MQPLLRARLSRYVARTRQAWLTMRLGEDWAPPGHFYSPLLHPRERHDVLRRIDYAPEELPGIDLREHAQMELLQELKRFYADLPFNDRDDRFRYHFGNGFFENADAIAYACLLRYLRPNRVLEIGSGHSSALALDVNELFLEQLTRLTFVEPYPARLHELTTGRPGRFDLIQEPVQCVQPTVFDQLDAGDFLFIDSSHVAKPGSDVNFLLFEVLPRLRAGVYVHIHDIFYPFEYPKHWIAEGRAWNEAYIVHAFLQFNDCFEVVLFNSLMGLRYTAWLRENMPLFLVDTGGSLWLRKR